jgi:hypothetical protein
MLIFIFVASVLRLPSGYTIEFITRQNYSVHFVFIFLFINNTIAFAFLWATLIRFARTASISATLWVLSMSLIA